MLAALATLPLEATAQTPAYTQLQRDVVINADLWSAQPEILAAGYGFEGIMGIPGLNSANDLALAVAAGAGVNLDWAGLDPLPPLRNLTSAASPLGIAAAGFGGSPLYGDAMPIEVSWPLLPSSVKPDNIAIRLNTGEVVTPTVASLNPNYDHNERHVIVVFGQFGNRLRPGEPGAVYPVEVSFVTGASPIMAIGPDGPVSVVGLSQASSNPYLVGPSLVGAKLSRFSPVGDFAPAALANAFPNDARALYGGDAEYRLRLFTSGGFSPDGVSGLLPTDFATFFRLHATDAEGEAVVIDEAGKTYDLGVGTLEVVGLAEVGAPVEGEPERAYYVEDHDNYFDIVLKGDEAAIRLLQSVEIPTSGVEGYSDLYNPGGPGRTPQAGTTYTRPALPQTFRIYLSLDSLGTVSWASRDWRDYDLDDDLPVVFRVRETGGAGRLTTSTNDVAALVGGGATAEGVDFANETARPGVSDVQAYREDATGDRIYTLAEDEQKALAADGAWQAEGRAFGAFDSQVLGSDPVFRFHDTVNGRHLFTPDLGAGLQQEGVEYQGVGWYSAVFPWALPSEIRFDRSDDVALSGRIDSDAALVKDGSGTLTVAAPVGFAGGVTVRAGRLAVDGLLSGGALSVGPGGTLSGGGLVGNRATVAGRLSPGSSPGTLVFLAPLALQADAELEIEVDGPSASGGAGGYDRVLVLGAGSDFTAGGSLAVRLRDISAPAGNDFTPALGQSFDSVVAAQGGIAGSFERLEQPAHGLPKGTRFDLVYDARSIDLVVTPASYEALAPLGIALGGNQPAVATALEAIRPAAGVRPQGAAGDLFPALAPLQAEAIPTALEALSGRVHAEVLDGAAAGQRLTQSLLAACMAQRLVATEPRPAAAAPQRDVESATLDTTAGDATAGDATAAPPPPQRDVAWAQLLGASAEQRPAEGLPGYDSRHRGLAIGADRLLPAGLRLGFAVGQTESEVSADDGRGTVTSSFVALYGAREVGGFRLAAQLLASLDDYDSERALRIGGFSADPEGETGGWGLAGAASLGRPLALGGGLTLEPGAGVAFGHLHRAGFTEADGGGSNLEIAAGGRTWLRSRLGATLGYAGQRLAGSLSLGWSRELLDEAASSEVALGGAAFAVRAAPPGRDAVDVGAGINVALAPGLTFGARYRLTASSRATGHAGMVDLRFVW